MMGWNALGVIPLVIGAAVSIVVGLPVLCALILSGRHSREEEKADEALARDLMAKRPTEPIYRERSRTGRERVVIDFDRATAADIAEAFDSHP